eukprot:3638567-Rhodomonas_salina.1
MAVPSSLRNHGCCDMRFHEHVFVFVEEKQPHETNEPTKDATNCSRRVKSRIPNDLRLSPLGCSSEAACRSICKSMRLILGPTRPVLASLKFHLRPGRSSTLES